jgi:hypothetical protein
MNQYDEILLYVSILFYNKIFKYAKEEQCKLILIQNRKSNIIIIVIKPLIYILIKNDSNLVN